jgi:histidyl-tRNA synthetase
MSYADAKHISFVVLVGENEMKEGLLTVKNMTTGEQFKTSIDELKNRVKY